ncbi:MAG: GEVED domain-containing protein, partial [Anaerolineae bacterium]|nr:GEVED domain-containing protein [Anaerolineae bacterium]
MKRIGVSLLLVFLLSTIILSVSAAFQRDESDHPINLKSELPVAVPVKDIPTSVTDVSPPIPVNKHPKLASNLVEMVQLYNQRGMQGIAAFNQIDPRLVDGSRVLVEIRYDVNLKQDATSRLVLSHAEIRHDIADTFVEAWVELDQLETIAADPSIWLIRPARIAQPTDEFIQVGGSTSQGVSLMNADDWHALGLNGEGVKIALIDSYDSDAITDLQDSGDWPPNSQLTMVDVDGGGFGSSGSSHGMATLEIAYDMAPGATFIAYETLTNGDWITALGLADAAGAHVSSASLSMPLDGIGDGTAQPGSIAEAAGNARTGGVLPINSAGNYRQQHWGGLYSVSSGGFGHNWGGGGNLNFIGPAGTSSIYCWPSGSTLFVTLHWNDWTNVNQDYYLRLYEYAPGWVLVASSDNLQNGGAGQTPEEAITYTVPSGGSWCSGGQRAYAILVHRKSGTTNNNIQVFNFSDEINYFVESRSLGFPADSANVYSIAAIGAGSGTQESFSSEGPILAPGGGIPGTTTHNKPDATSYSGVDTQSYGASGFGGTSSSAPHVAGAAVLLRQCDSTLTPDGLDAALDAQADDLGSSGFDYEHGNGNITLNSWTEIDRSDTPTHGEATHVRPNCTNAAQEPGIYLGSAVNLDAGALAQGGDDATDDGVTINPDWENGASGTVNVTVGGQDGFLWGWVDFNCDGDFTDGNEQIFSAQSVSEGANPGLSFSVPANFYTDCGTNPVYARFRVSTSSSGFRAASDPTGAATGGEVEDYAWDISTLPVTLAYANAEQTDGRISIAWQTATEAGTVGYNLYGIATDGSLVPLNDRLVVATGIATVQPQAYSLTVPTFDGDQYYIEDIGIRGEHDRHGPFTIGEPAGRPVSVSPIDWPAIQAEQDTYAAAQTATARTTLQSSFAADMAAAEQDGTLQPPAHPGIDIVVTHDGIQHITYQDLLNFGIDLAGQRSNRIAVTHEGEPVPLLITGGARVGPNTVIEFIGSARDTLYSDANIYNLTLRRDAAARMAVDNAAIPNGTPVATYQATVTVEEDNEYS